MNREFDLSIVVSSFNRKDKVIRTIQSVFASDISGFNAIELIIIDDGSPRPLKDLLPLFGEVPVRITMRLISQENTGIGATRNLGFREAGASLVLFLDDDIILNTDTLQKIFKTAQESNGAVIFGNYPFISHQSASLEKFARKLYGYNLITTEASLDKVDAITSGLLLIKKGELKELSYFYKDDLTIPAAEEYELIARFHKKGIPIYRANHITAIHNHHLELGWLVQQQYKYGQGTAEAFIKYPGIGELEKFAELKAKMDTLVKKGSKWFTKTIAASSPGRKLLLFCAKLAERMFPGADHSYLFGLTASAYLWAGYVNGWKRFGAAG